jgi:enoyl-CoA hydratase
VTAGTGGLVALELGRVAHLELANPPLNLFTEALVLELREALRAIAAADHVRAVVVSGRGERAFSAGSHVGEFEDQAGEAGRERHQLDQDVWRQLAELPMPTIAAIEGHCLGGGLELALCCDVRICSDDAKLGQPEVKLGVIPGFGGTQRLARRVGVAKAKELCMTGDPIGAAEALRIGLVDLVVPQTELLARVKDTAAKIAANGPLAVAEVKRLVHQGQSMSLDASLALEQRSFGLLFATADQKEGMAAFLAKPKRAAKFEGR